MAESKQVPYITNIKVNQVRHLRNVDIPICESEKKHLILTGGNGSGKTSVLHSIAQEISSKMTAINVGLPSGLPRNSTSITLSGDAKEAVRMFQSGEFLCALFVATRQASFSAPSGVVKISIPPNANIVNDFAAQFIQYLVNLKAEGSFARDDEDERVAQEIFAWFDNFEKRLQRLYFDDKLHLVFDRKNYSFSIETKGRDPIPLNKLSDGYSAIIKIIAEIILRMEAIGRAGYDRMGVVLIDEIETHLHIELQKTILPFLIDFFPNLQFIVTTHSPFVLSSTDRAVVFDLENQEPISDLSAFSSEAIVESYFGSDKYSNILKSKVAELECLLESNGDATAVKRRQELLEYFTKRAASIDPELEVKIQELRLKALSIR